MRNIEQMTTEKRSEVAKWRPDQMDTHSPLLQHASSRAIIVIIHTTRRENRQEVGWRVQRFEFLGNSKLVGRKDTNTVSRNLSLVTTRTATPQNSRAATYHGSVHHVREHGHLHRISFGWTTILGWNRDWFGRRHVNRSGHDILFKFPILRQRIAQLEGRKSRTGETLLMVSAR